MAGFCLIEVVFITGLTVISLNSTFTELQYYEAAIKKV